MNAAGDRVVAIIGAGPAGLFAAKQLAAAGCQVVLINRDVKPGGLAEYGIYVDKHRLKEGLRVQFRGVLARPNVHYVGNLTVGNNGDLTLEEVRGMGFDAVLVTVGAQGEKCAGIEGEDLPRVYHAKDMVYHYNHLPPFSQMDMPVGKKVVVVGAGNVMMDLTHWLIDHQQVDEVTAVVRRGPGQVKFDHHELESVAANLDMSGLHAEFERVSPVMLALGEDPQAVEQIYLDVRAKAQAHESATVFKLRFLASPHKIFGDMNSGVSGLEVEENTLVEDNGQVKARGTGVYRKLDCDTIIFAIGDLTDGGLGLPVQNGSFSRNPNPLWPVEEQSFEAFDPIRGEDVEGVFLAGWARQPSTGVVGIARRDGTNAALAMEAFMDGRASSAAGQVEKIVEKLATRSKRPVLKEDILRLEAREHAIASARGVEEFKYDSNEEMFAAMGE